LQYYDGKSISVIINACLRATVDEHLTLASIYVAYSHQSLADEHAHAVAEHHAEGRDKEHSDQVA